MREVYVDQISEEVAKLCQEANFFLPSDVLEALKQAQKEEESELGKEVLSQLIENARIAASEKIPLCQDCGLAVVFLEIGQEVLLKGGSLAEAVNKGVKRGYKEGFLRKSVVAESLFKRENTGDNTPTVIHLQIIPGDKVRILVTPKGGGSENSSALKMLEVASGIEGVQQFVLDTVREAGAKPCPPIIVGIGVGGGFSEVALLAHRALLRPLGEKNTDLKIGTLEGELLKEINNLGIGPSGLGGRITALGVNIETTGAHIASLPVAVNIGCYANRRSEIVI